MCRMWGKEVREGEKHGKEQMFVILSAKIWGLSE